MGFFAFLNIKRFHVWIKLIKKEFTTSTSAHKYCLKFLKLYNIIRSAADDGAYLLQSKHGDVPALFQRIKGPVINAALQELVLRRFLFLHRRPQRAIVDHRITPQFPLGKV